MSLSLSLWLLQLPLKAYKVITRSVNDKKNNSDSDSNSHSDSDSDSDGDSNTLNPYALIG
jgi:hypothetical protein